jgi:type IV secretory pathway VirB2 component (pilin)
MLSSSDTRTTAAGSESVATYRLVPSVSIHIAAAFASPAASVSAPVRRRVVRSTLTTLAGEVARPAYSVVPNVSSASELMEFSLDSEDRLTDAVRVKSESRTMATTPGEVAIPTYAVVASALMTMAAAPVSPELGASAATRVRLEASTLTTVPLASPTYTAPPPSAADSAEFSPLASVTAPTRVSEARPTLITMAGDVEVA